MQAAAGQVGIEVQGLPNPEEFLELLGELESSITSLHARYNYTQQTSCLLKHSGTAQ